MFAAGFVFGGSMISVNRIPLERVVRPQPQGPSGRVRGSRGPQGVLVSTFRPAVLRPNDLYVPTSEAELRDLSFSQLETAGLDERVTGYLNARGYFFVGDILDLTEDKLAEIPGLGPKMLANLLDLLRELIELGKCVKQMKSLDLSRKVVIRAEGSV